MLSSPTPIKQLFVFGNTLSPYGECGSVAQRDTSAFAINSKEGLARNCRGQFSSRYSCAFRGHDLVVPDTGYGGIQSSAKSRAKPDITKQPRSRTTHGQRQAGARPASARQKKGYTSGGQERRFPR